MSAIGTPFSSTATRVLMCGSGELGKEVVIELQRLGVEVIACDRSSDVCSSDLAFTSSYMRRKHLAGPSVGLWPMQGIGQVGELRLLVRRLLQLHGTPVHRCVGRRGRYQ